MNIIDFPNLKEFDFAPDDTVSIFDMRYFQDGVKSKRFKKIYMPEDANVDIAPKAYLVNNSILVTVPLDQAV